MKKILVVDDQPGLLQIFSEAFSDKSEFQVDIAATAYDAQQIFTKLEPDVLILDLALPDKDGRDLLEDLKPHPHFGQCKIVIMSAVASEEETQSTTCCPIALFLQKPFNIPEASQNITNLLN